MVLFTITFVLLVELQFGIRYGMRSDTWGRILPTFFYAVAIWSARRAVVRIEQGRGLHTLLSQLLMVVGIALFCGGLVRVFVVPLSILLASGKGSFAYYDVAAIALGAVGVALMVVAQLVRTAERAQAQLDEFI